MKALVLGCLLLFGILCLPFGTVTACTMDGEGVIGGSVRPQTEIVPQGGSCVFARGNSHFVPIRAGHKSLLRYRENDQTDQFSLGVQAHKARIELSDCFTQSQDLEHFNPFQKAWLAYSKQVANYCPNAVASGQKATLASYSLMVYIPSQPNIKTAKAIIAQWHGRPDRLLYQDQKGAVHHLPTNISRMHNADDLAREKARYDAVIQSGGVFEQGGYPPVSLQIKDGYVIAQVRSDPREFTDKSLRCNISDVATFPLYHSKTCGVGQQAIKVTMVYRDALDHWVGKWVPVRLLIHWNIKKPGAITLYVNNRQAAHWSGLIGRNDVHGPYMKYGIYAPSGVQHPFTVSLKSPMENIVSLGRKSVYDTSNP